MSDYDTIKEIRAERDKYLERSDRLRHSLEAIRDFEPTLDPGPPADFNAGCRGCKRARDIKWPTSGLCNDHYIIVDDIERANRRAESAQHWDMRTIARNVLSAEEE